MELPQTQAPFIVLENVSRTEGGLHSGRGLHVLSLAEKPMRFGRGHDCDVRIQDVSLSRHHASVRYHEGKFILQDDNSRFGTLVQAKGALQLETSHPLSLQVGRTVLSVAVKEE